MPCQHRQHRFSVAYQIFIQINPIVLHIQFTSRGFNQILCPWIPTIYCFRFLTIELIFLKNYSPTFSTATRPLRNSWSHGRRYKHKHTHKHTPKTSPASLEQHGCRRTVDFDSACPSKYRTSTLLASASIYHSIDTSLKLWINCNLW